MDEREFSPEDLEKNKAMAALGYVIFFVPLLKCGDSELGRYCANQGLVLTVLILLVNILGRIFSIVPFIGWAFTLAGSLAGFVLFCVGLLCSVQLTTHGKATELPFVGHFRLLP